MILNQIEGLKEGRDQPHDNESSNRRTSDHESMLIMLDLSRHFNTSFRWVIMLDIMNCLN